MDRQLSYQYPVVHADEKSREQLYETRRQTVSAACGHNVSRYEGDTADTDVMFNLFVDRSHQLLYCQIQKVGSSFIKKAIGYLTASRNYSSMFDVNYLNIGIPRLKHIQNLSFTHLHSLLRSSFKFMFVREPYGRLLSGYTNKLFELNPNFWRSVGRYVVSHVRPNASLYTCSGYDVTFPEFVKYVLHSEATTEHRNQHFTPMYEHCRPCQIRYDFIGKMETFKDDTMYLLAKLSGVYKKRISFYDFEEETYEHVCKAKANNIFKVKKEITKCTSFHNALTRTWKGLQIRGILSKNVTLPFTKEDSDKITMEQFRDSLLVALSLSGSKTSRKQNRMEALIEAYRMVPEEDLKQLHKLFMPDCHLFGYDPEPKYIFDRTLHQKTGFKYFVDLK